MHYAPLIILRISKNNCLCIGTLLAAVTVLVVTNALVTGMCDRSFGTLSELVHDSILYAWIEFSKILFGDSIFYFSGVFERHNGGIPSSSHLPKDSRLHGKFCCQSSPTASWYV